MADARLTSRAQAAALRRLSARASTASAAGAAPAVPLLEAAAMAAIEHLRKCGVRLELGLSDDELEHAEARYGVSFPSDLRAVLCAGLPLGGGFPDWRSGGAASLRLWIDAPKSALLAAAQRGDFWWKHWGSSDDGAATATARAALRRAPMLIPVYGRCYVAAASSGGPVIFVDEAAAHYCAANVCDFLLMDSLAAHLRSVKSAGAYIPEPISIPTAAAHNGESARRLIARCESNLGQSSRRKIDEGGGGGGVGGDDGILTHGWLCTSLGSSIRSSAEERKSSSVSSSRISRSSCEEVRIDSSSCSFDSGCSSSCSSSSSARSGSRRIDFWSDLVEKRHKLNVMARSNSSRITQEQSSGIIEEQSTDGEECGSTFVEGVVRSMSSKLRNAGWNEEEIAEICASSSKMGIDRSGDGVVVSDCDDREGVLHGLAQHLDALSSCLRGAGWSLHDVTDTLCLDDMSGFSQQRRRPARLELPADVAARISILAAFVAQG